MKLTNEELKEKGWSRCASCGAIRSPYTGLDWHNHSDEDCYYSRSHGFVINLKATPDEGPTTANNL